MNLPVVRKELLRQPGIGVDVSEERFGLPDKLRSSNEQASGQAVSGLNHPLEAVEDSHALEALRQELALAKRMCGSQLAQQLTMEIQACAQVGRQDGLPSSRLMLNTLLDWDMVGVEDILKNPDNIEIAPDALPMGSKKI